MLDFLLQHFSISLHWLFCNHSTLVYCHFSLASVHHFLQDLHEHLPVVTVKGYLCCLEVLLLESKLLQQDSFLFVGFSLTQDAVSCFFGAVCPNLVD